MMRGRPMTDSALVLLSTAARQPLSDLSLRDVEAITGIPYSTIRHLLTDRRDVVDSVAYAYGYYYRVRRAPYSVDMRESRIIEAVQDWGVRGEELSRP